MSQPAVLFGGPSPEHDVSVLTGLPAGRALTRAGHAVTAIYWAKSRGFFEVDPDLEAGEFREGVPKGARELRLVASPGGGFIGAKGGLLGKERPLDISAVINCCHGGPGEDGTLQAALDLAGLAYTGPTVAGAALGMDKLAFGGAMAAAGLPTLAKALIQPGQSTTPTHDGPYIVKPRFGGSSIGIEVVQDWPTAIALTKDSVHLRRGAVVERYLEGSFDLNIGVRTWPELQLSAIERPLRSAGSSEILGYQDKYLAGGEGMVSAPRQLPAEIPGALEKAIRDAAASVAALALVRGVARIDFLVDGDDWYVNEVNTIPGSLARYLWVEPAPVLFTTLLTDMLAEAVKSPSCRYDATGADGVALRSAGSIAGKLG